MTHDGFKRLSKNLGEVMLPDGSILKLLVPDTFCSK